MLPPPEVSEVAGAADGIDDEIYGVFAEEFEETLARLQLQIPQWNQARHDTKLLIEIRRAFHTFKGSGRMLNRLALGDYAWAHEDMLNQVISGDLPRSDGLAELLQRSLVFLTQQQTFFITTIQPQPVSQAEVTAITRFIAQPIEAFDDKLTNGQIETSNDAQSVAHTSSTAKPTAKADAMTSEMADDSEDNQLIWQMFREELPEQLQVIDQLMQDLYEDAHNAKAAQALERELHTLKGGARMARLVQMADVAHEAEELLIKAKQRADQNGEQARRDNTFHASHKSHDAQRLSPDIERLQTRIDLISTLAEEQALSDIPIAKPAVAAPTASENAENRSADFVVLAAGLLTANGQGAAGSQDHGSYLEQLLADQAAELPDISVLNQLVAAEEAVQAETDDEQGAPLLTQEQVRLSANYLDKMIEDANTLNIEQHTLNERLHAMGEDVGEFGRTAARLKHLLRSLELETEARVHAGYQQAASGSSTKRAKTGGQGKNKNKNGHFDPLEMDEYSEIQRLSRALAESLNDLVNIEGDLYAQLRSASEFIKQSLYNSRGLHHDLLATRLVEVAVLAPRLRRILRQTAAELGQKVTLELSGEELKLDRHLLQRMTAPIEHLLRNAVSHGIEPSVERERLQKPAGGKVSLSVYREENEVVFCIRDDGRGLDNERILQQARSMGLVTAKAQLSKQEIQRLILRAGFSTAESLNQIAGRGVGMDVVNAEVKALGGHLLIDSEPGAGTTFTIRLPFTMASNPVLFVTVQEQPYALPLGTVQGLNRVAGETLQQHLNQQDKPAKQLSFNDENYPVYYLGAALGHEHTPLMLRGDAMYPVIYTRAGGERVAWVVDAVQGRRDVILQSLGALFQHCHFYASATITPEGQVVMVPDMPELTERILSAPAQQLEHLEQQGNHNHHNKVTAATQQSPTIMVVDDSVTVRKVTEKFLLHENFRVVTARDGLEALEKLDSVAPDLLLLDIEMPRMDGFELLGALRGHERWHSVPVIMVSSRTAEKHQAHAMQLGANDFLGKPYQDQALLTHIKKHLVNHDNQAAVKAGSGNNVGNNTGHNNNRAGATL